MRVGNDPYLAKGDMTMRDEFKITQRGKEYVLYAGLLDEAHNKGIKKLHTDLLQIPAPDNGNVAIVKAFVVMADDAEFSGIGDASPDTRGAGPAEKSAPIRMAETRAKARALRDAINVEASSFEDRDIEEEGESPREARGTRETQASRRSGEVRGGSSGGNQGGSNANVQSLRGAGKNATAPDPNKARKSQKDLLRQLLSETGRTVEAMEGAIGKGIDELTRTEADQWIDRLTAALDKQGGRVTATGLEDDVELDEDDLEEIEDLA